MKFQTSNGVLSCTPDRLIVAGWTGRDLSSVDHHIAELAELGVPAPSSVPLYYECAPALLTQESEIHALGTKTSGEAEPFLLRLNGQIWLGLASDHTDRALEAHSVAASKQICAKPVAETLWRFDEVEPNLDDYVLRSWIEEDGSWTLYQEGTLASILPLRHLIEGAGLTDGSAMLCGTLPAIGGVRPSAGFRMSLSDPTNGQSIDWRYRTTNLRIIS
ncbi:DUF2848 domain-containing protein [uncultured Roseibium sp.]|uniref:DUF2848 domain-containing protein n=1 Tax=uncultured Roseibium sp. TaxID=1936171 RepID=UPI00261BF499|nr:DUF2848 domain-containing protein [uncultured Roseibium sp.]